MSASEFQATFLPKDFWNRVPLQIGDMANTNAI